MWLDHWEYLAGDSALEVRRLFCSRRYAYKREGKQAGVVYLVDYAVEELRGGRGLSDDHQGLPLFLAGIGEPVVQFSALHVCGCASQDLVLGAQPPKVAYDFARPEA